MNNRVQKVSGNPAQSSTMNKNTIYIHINYNLFLDLIFCTRGDSTFHCLGTGFLKKSNKTNFAKL